MHVTIFLQDEKYTGSLWSRHEKVLPSNNMYDRRPSATPGIHRRFEYVKLEEFWSKIYNTDETFALHFGVSELPEFTDYDKVKEIVDLIKDKDNIYLMLMNDFDIYDHQNWNREDLWYEALEQMPHERIEFMFNNTLTVQKFKEKFPKSKVEFGSRFIQRLFEFMDKPVVPTTRFRNKHFLCLNSRPEIHRDKIYYHLEEKNNSYLSYRLRNVFLDEDNPWNEGQKQVFLNDPKSINDETGNFADDPNMDWQTYQDRLDEKYYNDVCVYICTETLFGTISYAQPRGHNETKSTTHWWTEKLLKSFWYKMPAIVVGCPYVLESIRTLGFKTFNDFWDESYDWKIDNDQRMDIIIKNIDMLSDMSIQDLNDMYYSDKMQEILNHNYQNIFKLNDKYVCS